MKLLKKRELLELEFDIDECIMLVNAIRINYVDDKNFSYTDDKRMVFLCNTLNVLVALLNIYSARENNEIYYI